MAITRTLSMLVLLALVCLGAMPVSASEELDRAKELYRSAAYDEALSVLDGLSTEDDAEEIAVYEYRILCLVALDRRDDAKNEMAALVVAEPTYAMSEAEASPRVRTLFTEVRRATLPSVIQRAYADAKALFDRKDPKALAQFDRILTLLKDPDVADNRSLTDLAVVVTGFRDLSATLVPPKPPEPAAAPPVVAAAPAPPVLTPPVVVSQPVPIAQLREEREWNGEIEVTINDRGRVISARMTRPIHPVYDQQLVRAALAWTYRPALRDGTPITFTKTITINVDTRPLCSVRSTEPCRPSGEP